MSIQDNGGVSYADHDVHHVNHRVIQIGGTGGGNFNEPVIEEYEITERGLDPDELAELRAMRVQVGAFVEANSDQTERGEFTFSIDAGFNIGESDALHLQDGSDVNLDPNGDGTDEIKSTTRQTDEVGQVFSFSDSYSIGWDDDANGNGGPTVSQSTTETLNMNELFGSGPFVDSADDFVSVVRASPDNVVETLGVNVNYSLYYDVNETEGGRSRFGR